MNYTTDFEKFKRESLEAKRVGGSKASIGIGAWLALENSNFLENQVSFLKKNDFPGVVLFSYGNLSNRRGDDLYRKVSSIVLKD